MLSKTSMLIPRSALVLVLVGALLVVLPGLSEADVIAYDMVGSASQNLVSFTDDPAIPFTSSGDGFNKFQRGVSASIPFAVVDDSAGSFPGDTQGIIKTGTGTAGAITVNGRILPGLMENSVSKNER